MRDGRTAPGRGRVRAFAAVAAVVTVAAGLAVRAEADGAVAKYAGSALYTVLLCALVVLCAPRARPSRRPPPPWP